MHFLSECGELGELYLAGDIFEPSVQQLHHLSAFPANVFVFCTTNIQTLDPSKRCLASSSHNLTALSVTSDLESDLLTDPLAVVLAAWV